MGQASAGNVLAAALLTQHQVIATRFEFHSLSWPDLDAVFEPAHLHDALAHRHFVHFNLGRNWQ
jgi:hypothetical protein